MSPERDLDKMTVRSSLYRRMSETAVSPERDLDLVFSRGFNRESQSETAVSPERDLDGVSDFHIRHRPTGRKRP